MSGRVWLVVLGVAALVTLLTLPLRRLPPAPPALPPPPAAKRAPPLAGPLDDRPWERLADGRAVIEVKGLRLALAPDVPDGSPDAGTLAGFSNYYFGLVNYMPVREVIGSPGRARAVFALPELAILSVLIGDRRARWAWPAGLLNRYERAMVPAVYRFFITVEDATGYSEACEPERRGRLYTADPIGCDERRDLLADDRAPEDAPFLPTLGRFKPDATVEEMRADLDARSPGNVHVVVNPALRARYGAGPIRFWCSRDVGDFTKPGHCSAAAYIAPRVSLNYQFWTREHPRERWLEGHGQLAAIARDILDIEE